MAVISTPAKVLSSRPQAHSQGTSVRGNVDLDSQSLRGFLRLVETQYPDELLRIRQPIDLRFEFDGAGVRTRPGGEKPRGGVRERERQRHAAGHQRRRQPQAAGCLPRRGRRQPPHGISRTLPEIHSLRDRGSRRMGGRGHRGGRCRPDKTAGPAAILGGCGALHHRRPDRRPRPRDRHRHHGLSSPDAEGQEPARRVAAFTPSPVRIPPPRRRTGSIPAGGHHARSSPAALYGLDGLRLPAAGEEVRDHRRPVRRTLPARPFAA